MQKKIAILCNYKLLPERVGGMDYFFWLFDKKCKENNIHIDWFFPNKSDHGDYPSLSIMASNFENVENYFLNFHKENKLEYSHIITHFIELCTSFFFKIKRVSNAKIIAVDHNPRPLNGYPFKKKVAKKVKGLMFSRFIDAFIGVSDYTVHEIINDFGNHLQSKTKLIYNGVLLDDIKIRTIRQQDKPRFLVVSHLRESKGIQDLIDAVFLLPIVIKNEIQITIYGEGSYKEILVKRIETRKLKSNFVFMGSKPNLNEIYCEYDYMIQPTHMECFSLSILESLAANVPVITTNVGGNEEAITHGENGFIFSAKNVTALAIILEEVYLGLKKIDLNTRIEIERRFSLEKMVDNHFKLIS